MGSTAIRLGYASGTAVRATRVWLGAAAMLVGVAAMVWILAGSVDLADRAFYALLVPTDCGTGRHEANMTLCGVMPWLHILPAGAWVMAVAANWGVRVCRCAFVSSVTGWAACVAAVMAWT